MAGYTTLRKGSTGDEVKKLQTSLGITADGIFGSQTDAAVREYQKNNGLTVDGIVGKNTWGSLNKSSTAAPSATSTAPSVNTSDATNTALNKVKELESQKPGAFTYEIPQSSWQNQVNDTLNKILNREDFSYDLNGDALYQQYKDQYTTQGQMAMMDTMGQAQAMTGGYGNSYAQSVGQQTYQGYLQQLNDKVPELYQLALNQYNQEGQGLKDLYALYTDMDDREYSRNMDKINMDYTANRDAVTDWQNELNRADSNYWNLYGYDYQLGRDAVEDAWKQKEFDEAVRQFNASQKGSSGGKVGSLTTSTPKNMINKAVNNIVKKANEPAPTGDTKEYYANWNAGDWEGYFANIRQTEGKAAAEEELRYFTSKGLIPQKFVTYGAIGARGSSGGH